MPDSSGDITIRFFSVLRERAGTGHYDLPVEGPRTLEEVEDVLIEKFPDIRAYRSTWRCAVNHEYADSTREVVAGDEVALITPVSGG